MLQAFALDRGLGFGFAAGIAAAFLIARLPLGFLVPSRTFNREKAAKSHFVRHLDSQCSQRGLEITDDQLHRAKNLSAFNHSKKKVLKINSNTVVKLGPNLDITEVDNIGFIHSHTTIPVPKILNVYEKDGCQYILMEFLDGEKLETVWPNLSPAEKGSICLELREYLRQMREIPPPADFIGSVTGGPAVDRRSLGPIKGGPFSCEEDFNKWQLAQMRENTPLLNQEIYSAMHRTDHSIVFSHGDLGFHNILVHNGRITAILDWEYSGWYPEHWDFCKSLQFLAGTDELYLFCKKAFGQQYLREYFMDTWFNREVKHGGW
ncbi:Uncharacterized protein TPAR_05618 [Tolypocladium paradoxum]|uniref:Aminoglycoside phosphotransferase domain-containing protein n=1 Tax=Tolypocladium paradoxum TaxID=94208 RepID=A0A2S4KVL2_9HYPO|nr:Uncharacterized protein TPAR_05618 [Tolypocladium paradoxum]